MKKITIILIIIWLIAMIIYIYAIFFSKEAKKHWNKKW